MENDSIINFYFKDESLPVLVLDPGEIQYYSLSKPSYDSMYVAGRIKGENGVGVEFASVLLSDKITSVTDSTGWFQIIVPRSMQQYIDYIVVIKKISGFEIAKIPLNKNFNYHNVDVRLARIDSTMCLPVYDSDPLFGRYLSGSKPFSLKMKEKDIRNSNLSISLSSETIEGITNKLNQAMKVQPYLASNIGVIIEMIR